MWHVVTWFGGGFGIAEVIAGLNDLLVFSNLNNSMIFDTSTLGVGHHITEVFKAS